MATFTKAKLSASTDGRGIKLAATSTPGTTIHTGSSSTSTTHEVWLYLANPDTAAHVVTIEFGGVSNPDDRIMLTVASQSGLVLVTPGLVIVGNATPLIMKGYADTTNVIMAHGYVNVIA